MPDPQPAIYTKGQGHKNSGIVVRWGGQVRLGGGGGGGGGTQHDDTFLRILLKYFIASKIFIT